MDLPANGDTFLTPRLVDDTLVKRIGESATEDFLWLSAVD